MFDREKVIDELVDSDVNDIRGVEWVMSKLRTGFKGYENMSDEELISECEDRDISYLFGDTDDGASND